MRARHFDLQQFSIKLISLCCLSQPFNYQCQCYYNLNLILWLRLIDWKISSPRKLLLKCTVPVDLLLKPSSRLHLPHKTFSHSESRRLGGCGSEPAWKRDGEMERQRGGEMERGWRWDEKRKRKAGVHFSLVKWTDVWTGFSNLWKSFSLVVHTKQRDQLNCLASGMEEAHIVARCRLFGCNITKTVYIESFCVITVYVYDDVQCKHFHS